MTPDSTSPPLLSIVLPCRDSTGYIEECLDSIQRSLEKAALPSEIIAVDDGSKDDTAGLIQSKYADVTILRNAVPHGFARSCNRGARAARGRILMIFNSDVTVERDCIEKLAAPFLEERQSRHPIFAVSALVEEPPDVTPNRNRMLPRWKRAGIGAVHLNAEHRTDTVFICGGAAAFDHALFLRLEGFDSLFTPGFWEDFDLSFQAVRAGWINVYEPHARVEHLADAASRRMIENDVLNQVDERNRLFFNWLNLEGRRYWIKHLLGLPCVYLGDFLMGRGSSGPRGFLRALSSLPAVISRRRRRKQDHPDRPRSLAALLVGPKRRKS